MLQYWRTKMNSKEQYFKRIAEVVASRSKCLSRKIGAVLVRGDIIISTGYNGPPRGVPHCLFDRLKVDEVLHSALSGRKVRENGECPRRVLGYGSGQGLDLCPATHAEANAIVQAAKVGVSTEGTTMYLTCEFPCKSCLGLIINAGISRIVCTNARSYDHCSEYMYASSKLIVSLYKKEVLNGPS